MIQVKSGIKHHTYNPATKRWTISSEANIASTDTPTETATTPAPAPATAPAAAAANTAATNRGTAEQQANKRAELANLTRTLQQNFSQVLQRMNEE